MEPQTRTSNWLEPVEARSIACIVCTVLAALIANPLPKKYQSKIFKELLGRAGKVIGWVLDVAWLRLKA